MAISECRRTRKEAIQLIPHDAWCLIVVELVKT